MWPVTIEMMVRVKPPMPVTCPNGATIAVTRLTTASVLMRRPPTWIDVDEAAPPTGTAVEGPLSWPTICVGAFDSGTGGGGPLEGVLTAASLAPGHWSRRWEGMS